MSPFDPSDPPNPAETGVRVLVHDHPAPAPAWEDPEPPRRGPEVMIVPASQLGEGRDAFIASLDAKWGGFIEKELARWHDVAKASRPDVHQEVLVILCAHHEKEEKAGRPTALGSVQAFLRTVVGNAARNHGAKKKRRPRLDLGVDLGEEPDAGLDPERAAVIAELQEKLGRYRQELTNEEKEVFEAREVDGLTFEMIAALLGRPYSTIRDEHARAMERLRALARASERGTALAQGAGVGRKAGGGGRT